MSGIAKLPTFGIKFDSGKTVRAHPIFLGNGYSQREDPGYKAFVTESETGPVNGREIDFQAEAKGKTKKKAWENAASSLAKKLGGELVLNW